MLPFHLFLALKRYFLTKLLLYCAVCPSMMFAPCILLLRPITPQLCRGVMAAAGSCVQEHPVLGQQFNLWCPYSVLFVHTNVTSISPIISVA
jgi:hypothetical protein